MDFEWDEKKRDENWKNHKVDFNEAINVFFDDYRIEDFDQIKDEEERFKAIGSSFGIVLFVSFTYKENSIRIISARKAVKNERKEYYKNFG